MSLSVLLFCGLKRESTWLTWNTSGGAHSTYVELPGMRRGEDDAQRWKVYAAFQTALSDRDWRSDEFSCLSESPQQYVRDGC